MRQPGSSFELYQNTGWLGTANRCRPQKEGKRSISIPPAPGGMRTTTPDQREWQGREKPRGQALGRLTGGRFVANLAGLVRLFGEEMVRELVTRG